jgi:hypothetical protein
MYSYVVVRESNNVPASGPDSGVSSIRQPLLALKNVADADAGIRGKRLDRFGRFVGAIVIDNDQFPGDIGRRAQLCQAAQSGSQSFATVVRTNDYTDHSWIWIQGFVPTPQLPGLSRRSCRVLPTA